MSAAFSWLAAGMAMIPVVYLHCGLAGRISGKRSTFGVALAVLLLLLAVSYLLRKWIGKHWKRLHQFLAAILVMVTLYHSFIEFM